MNCDPFLKGIAKIREFIKAPNFIENFLLFFTLLSFNELPFFLTGCKCRGVCLTHQLLFRLLLFTCKKGR